MKLNFTDVGQPLPVPTCNSRPHVRLDPGWDVGPAVIVEVVLAFTEDALDMARPKLHSAIATCNGTDGRRKHVAKRARGTPSPVGQGQMS